MRDIPGYEGRYAVTVDGQVWSYPKSNRSTGGWLKFHNTEDGYLRVNLAHGDKNKRGYLDHWLVHRLVALSWLKDIPGKTELNHIDCNKKNNHASNLEWVTRSENQKHARAHGLIKQNKEAALRGSHAAGALKRKLTMEQVREIRKLSAAGGISHRELGRRYGVTHTSIGWIVSGRTYKDY